MRELALPIPDVDEQRQIAALFTQADSFVLDHQKSASHQSPNTPAMHRQLADISSQVLELEAFESERLIVDQTCGVANCRRAALSD